MAFGEIIKDEETIKCCLVTDTIKFKLKWKKETYKSKITGGRRGPTSKNSIDVEVKVEHTASRKCVDLTEYECGMLKGDRPDDIIVTPTDPSSLLTIISLQKIQSCGPCFKTTTPLSIEGSASPEDENLCKNCYFKFGVDDPFPGKIFTVTNGKCSGGWEKNALKQLEKQLNDMCKNIKRMDCDCGVNELVGECAPCKPFKSIKWSDIDDLWDPGMPVMTPGTLIHIGQLVAGIPPATSTVVGIVKRLISGKKKRMSSKETVPGMDFCYYP